MLDGLGEGFAVSLIRNGTKPVDKAREEEVLQKMADAGAEIIEIGA